MKNLRYTLQDYDQLPDRLDWLTPDELTRHEGFRFDKRRQDWLLGRWAAKQALLALHGLPQCDVGRFEILSASSGAPLARFDGKPYETGLSISHSNGRAFSVVSTETTELGCDIELVEPRSVAFVETFFTAAECKRVQRAAAEYRDMLVTMIWSAKESTLKVQRTGLRADTRSVEVIEAGDEPGGAWNRARTITADAREFDCLWRCDDRWILSVVAQDLFEHGADVV